MGSRSGKLKDKYLEITPRKAWGARKPVYEDPQNMPVSLVVFASSQICRVNWDDKKAVYKLLREMQIFHMYHRYMPDIQYNFMIDAKGNIYEGRGWFTKPSHNPGDNTANLRSIYIGYMGKITDEGPTDDMMKAGNDLISFGMRHEYIRYHHHIKGLITGIVGTTLEDCIQRRTGPSDSEDGEPPVEPKKKLENQIMDQFFM